MDRQPEKALMEDILQVRSYADADFSETDADFISRLQCLVVKYKRIPQNGDLILDLGCGPGNITERLVTLWPHTYVLGIDGSAEMLRTAQSRALEKFSSQVHIRYLKLHLSSQNIMHSTIKSSSSLVVSNSLLHHFKESRYFWKVVKSVAKKNSFVFHRDLRRPKSKEAAHLLQEKYASNCSQILKNDYMASLHAAFTLKEVREQLNDAKLPNLNVLSVGDQYLEVFGNL